MGLYNPGSEGLLLIRRKFSFELILIERIFIIY